MKRAALFLALAGCASVEPAPRRETVVIPGTSVAFDLVRVQDFWMGAREVTWAEFNLFYEFAGDQDLDGVTRPSRGKDYLALSGLPNEFMQPERPLTSVRYHSAIAYCEWLSRRTGDVYRLPTGTEWALAREPEVQNVGWTRESGAERTHVGGEKPANALGVHDMTGNVWEYVLEPLAQSVFEPVLRGGAWNTSYVDGATAPADWSLADPNRPFSTWWFRTGYSQGFRVVRVGVASDRAEREAYASMIRFGPLTGKEHEKVLFTRVTGTVTNAGDRSLRELILKVSYLDPKGKPHLEDRANTLTKRATFNLAFPVLVGSSTDGPHARPLQPGETRGFSADLPISLDPPEEVDLDRFGASVWSLRIK